MKKLFGSWNKKEKLELEVIFKECLIAFDTNVLLNLYRISPELSAIFFQIAEKMNDRLFLPYHAALEFHRHRYNQVNENIKLLKAITKKINEFETTVLNEHNENLISSKLISEISSELENNIKIIEDRIEYYQSLEKNDTIYEKLDNLFIDKIEEKFSEAELDLIYKEGKDRYQNNIPPGYQDKYKANGNKYGDLIIWKELIRKAKTEKKAILFVTNDEKEDWIWKQKDNKTIGPRPELIEEILNEAQVSFTINNFKSFIFFAAELNNITLKENIKDEFKLEYIIKNKSNLNIENISIPTNNTRIQDLVSEKVRIVNVLNDIGYEQNISDNTDDLLKGELNKKLDVLNQTINQLQTHSYSGK